MFISLRTQQNSPSFASSNLKHIIPCGKVAECRGEEILSYMQKLGVQNEQGISRIKLYDIPIKSEGEYNEVIKRITKAKRANGNNLWNEDAVRTYYSNVSNKELGLLPYCGENDVSANINLYLSGRLNNPEVFEQWKSALLPETVITDVIRALDYSLGNLDSEFGKYKGVVYRQGFMGENSGQFFSTSKNPSIAGQMNNNWLFFNPDRGFSVIRVKDGHNIFEFQKKMGTEFAEKEEEILIPRKSRFRLVKDNEMDEELTNGKNNLAGKMFFGADMLINGEIKECNGYTKKDLLNIIKVFDEI